MSARHTSQNTVFSRYGFKKKKVRELLIEGHRLF